MNYLEKYKHLTSILRDMESVLVAFSGGVDSTFLLTVAHQVLGNNAIAAIAHSVLIPKSELNFAREFACTRDIPLKTISFEPLNQPVIQLNEPERCYHCKKLLFNQLISLKETRGIKWIAEGSNNDDQKLYRPGNASARELGIRQPLAEAGLTKNEIRILSRNLNLPTWNKPSMACLATRFPYGEALTSEKLFQVEKAEEFIKKIVSGEFRVRHHGTIARIEVTRTDTDLILNHLNPIVSMLKSLGFSYICFDLEGFRSGSMDEVMHKIRNKD
jgi:uncharacterized protein